MGNSPQGFHTPLPQILSTEPPNSILCMNERHTKNNKCLPLSSLSLSSTIMFLKGSCSFFFWACNKKNCMNNSWMLPKAHWCKCHQDGSHLTWDSCQITVWVSACEQVVFGRAQKRLAKILSWLKCWRKMQEEKRMQYICRPELWQAGARKGARHGYWRSPDTFHCRLPLVAN